MEQVAVVGHSYAVTRHLLWQARDMTSTHLTNGVSGHAQETPLPTGSQSFQQNRLKLRWRLWQGLIRCQGSVHPGVMPRGRDRSNGGDSYLFDQAGLGRDHHPIDGDGRIWIPNTL